MALYELLSTMGDDSPRDSKYSPSEKQQKYYFSNVNSKAENMAGEVFKMGQELQQKIALPLVAKLSFCHTGKK